MQHEALAPMEFLARLLVAMGLGALIGLERELRNHEAGLKTNALVATGSSIFVMMACTFSTPDRIVGQILPGIGFLGAGMIMRDGLHVRGLNTAATLWCSASIGTLAGLGQRTMPAIATAAVVAANIILRQVADWIDKRHAASAAKEEVKTGQ
jgi:putative Mg2+ transporter-C (MgtC) family protein